MTSRTTVKVHEKNKNKGSYLLGTEYLNMGKEEDALRKRNEEEKI
jgi:hypothetical protein